MSIFSKRAESVLNHITDEGYIEEHDEDKLIAANEEFWIGREVVINRLPNLNDAEEKIKEVNLNFSFKIKDNANNQFDEGTLWAKWNAVNVENEATVFDFPIGNKGYVGGAWVPYRESFDNRDSYSLNTLEKKIDKYRYANPSNKENESYTDILNGEKWENIQDFNAYFEPSSPYHAGEDWNYRTGISDVGKNVYSCAPGVIVGRDTKESGQGDYVVILHKLESPMDIYKYKNGNSYVFSAYLHIKVADNIKKGDQINGGDKIGEIASKEYMGKADPHLHFSMRTKHIKGKSILYYEYYLENQTDYYYFVKLRIILSPLNILNKFKTIYLIKFQ